MAVFVIGSKVYDTTKMKRIATVKKTYRIANSLLEQLTGKQVVRTYECQMLRSEKGNWLLVREEDYNRKVGEAIAEYEAKELLKQYEYKRYVELFGELEEA